MKNRAFFEQYANEILSNDVYQQSKHIYSHGSITIYDHSIDVAERAYSMIEDNPKYNKVTVIRAALLHDFFLYEWHVWGMRYVMHGWAHPRIAADKARQVFGISDAEYECIRTHMWPWTPFALPRSREAWVISLADKIVALKEATTKRGRRHPLRDPGAA